MSLKGGILSEEDLFDDLVFLSSAVSTFLNHVHLKRKIALLTGHRYIRTSTHVCIHPAGNIS